MQGVTTHWLAPVLMETLRAVGRRDPPPVDIMDPPLGSSWVPGCGRL